MTFSDNAYCHYDKCHYANCHYAKCHYAKCHYAKCPYADLNFSKCHYAECQYVECHSAECSSARKITMAHSSGSANDFLVRLLDHFVTEFMAALNLFSTFFVSKHHFLIYSTQIGGLH